MSINIDDNNETDKMLICDKQNLLCSIVMISTQSPPYSVNEQLIRDDKKQGLSK